jgi:hypothetical protein
MPQALYGLIGREFPGANQLEKFADGFSVQSSSWSPYCDQPFS